MSYENDEWANEDEELPAEFFDGLPQPTFWRVMVMPVKPKEMTKSGFVIPKVNQDAQEILNFMGKVVAIGPTAGVHERLGGDGTKPAPGFPQVGDYVIYGRYAGQHLRYRNDYRLILINDDEILGTVPNPDLLKSSV